MAIPDSGAGRARLPTGYRADWETRIVLVDGTVAFTRPIRPDDAGALVEFHEALSTETVRLRFFNVHLHLLPAEIAHFVEIDYHDRVALVALVDDTLVAVGRYERLPNTTEAEVAFVVADAFQGRGLGTVLLEQLATAARSCGLDRFVANTLPDNHRMLEVFRNAGFPQEVTFADGVIRVSFAIDPCERYLAAREQRERIRRHDPSTSLAP